MNVLVTGTYIVLKYDNTHKAIDSINPNASLQVIKKHASLQQAFYETMQACKRAQDCNLAKNHASLHACMKTKVCHISLLQACTGLQACKELAARLQKSSQAHLSLQRAQ